MAKRKIIFFLLVGVVGVILIFTLTQLTKQNTQVDVPPELKIWINEGTTDNYETLINGFKQFAPEYKNMKITLEKKTENADRYRTLLLSTMTEGSGPDIFMLRFGEDEILEGKVAPIPGDVIDIHDFEKRFDMTVFNGLISASGSERNQSQFLLGVPMGYETLGVFYNRSLMRSGVPNTWDQVSSLYSHFPQNTYPTNLGLGPKWVPNMVDIVTLFLISDDARSYRDIRGSSTAFRDYASFADIEGAMTEDDNIYTSRLTLRSTVSQMELHKTTTLDAFLRGEIGMIIGYSSLVGELEKSQKRAGVDGVTDLIYTERLPKFSSREDWNVARYSYFGISRLSAYPDASLKFMQYLMSPEAQRLAMEIYPYWIPAQGDFLMSRQGGGLSSVIRNAKIDAFLPSPGQRAILFQYGIKSQFQEILETQFDALQIQEVSKLGEEIYAGVTCELMSQYGETDSRICK